MHRVRTWLWVAGYWRFGRHCRKFCFSSIKLRKGAVQLHTSGQIRVTALRFWDRGFTSVASFLSLSNMISDCVKQSFPQSTENDPTVDRSWFTCGVHTGPLQGHRDDDAVARVSSRALPGFLPALPPETRPWPVSKAGILGWICLSWFKSPCSLHWSDLVNREFYEHQGFNPLRLSKPSTSLWTCQIRGRGGGGSFQSEAFVFCLFLQR